MKYFPKAGNGIQTEFALQNEDFSKPVTENQE